MAFVVGLVWRQPQGWSESGGDAEPADEPDFRYSSDPLLRLVTKDQAGKVCIEQMLMFMKQYVRKKI